MNTCPEPHILINAAYGLTTAHDAHIASCASCKADIADLNVTRSALAEVPPVAPRTLELPKFRRETVPYGAIAATVLILVTFLIGFRFEMRADGSWMFHIGVIRSDESVPAVIQPTQHGLTTEEIQLIQDRQLTAIAAMIRESKRTQNAEFGALLGEYASLSETRRSLDYELIQMELDDLRARTDDHLYKSNLVMYQLLSQLSHNTSNTD